MWYAKNNACGRVDVDSKEEKKKKNSRKTGRLAKGEGKGNRVYKRKGLRGSEGHKNETVRKIRYG